MTKTHGFKLEHDAIWYFNQKLMRKIFTRAKLLGGRTLNSRRKNILFQLVS